MKSKLRILIMVLTGIFMISMTRAQEQDLSKIIPAVVKIMMSRGIEIDYTQAKAAPAEFIEDIIAYYETSGIKDPNRIMAVVMLECLGENWDNAAWTNDFKELMSYDANLNHTQSTYLEWDNGAWLNDSRWSYTYNSNGDITYQLTEVWDNGSWVNETQWFYTYDANGNQTVFEWQVWENGAWVGFMKWLSTYDANNLLTLFIQQMWDNGAYADFTRTTYTYDANNHMSVAISEMFLGFWMNSSKENYTWDANGNNTEILTESWDMMTNSWVNQMKEMMSYGTNNLLTEMIMQEWDGAAWRNLMKILHHYTNSLLTLSQTYQWDGSSWANDTKTIHTYDAQNNLIESLNQTWDGNNWVNDSRCTYTWGNPTTSAEDNDITPADFELKQNYPNPFNPSTKIEFSLAEPSKVSLEVFDALGNIVSTLASGELAAGNYKIEFNAKNLTSGIYFYKLTSNNFMITRKMMLIK